MTLWDRVSFFFKANRAQPSINTLEGDYVRSDSVNYKLFFEKSFQQIEVINRGCNLIIDGGAEINTSITGRLPIEPRTLGLNGQPQYVRQKLLNTILNFRPNPEENIEEFRRQLMMDLLMTGNAYQYFDGKDLWHLPARLMEVKSGQKNKVDYYLYDGKTQFSKNEIIHTKDNSSRSVYIGESRLNSAIKSILVLSKMLEFQEVFFDNGAIPGMILLSENILGQRMKDRMTEELVQKYTAVKKGRRPIILDGDLKPHPLSNQTFRELDFSTSVEQHEVKILKALGVPPILLNAGNNANISPNIKLFYENTILPISNKFIGSYESFFGYDLEPDVFKIRALRPELREAGNFYTSMVNNGIMTVNEARLELRLEESPEEKANELREPVNVTGSATDPSTGGRPEGESEEDES